VQKVHSTVVDYSGIHWCAYRQAFRSNSSVLMLPFDIAAGHAYCLPILNVKDHVIRYSFLIYTLYKDISDFIISAYWYIFTVLLICLIYDLIMSVSIISLYI